MIPALALRMPVARGRHPRGRVLVRRGAVVAALAVAVAAAAVAMSLAADEPPAARARAALLNALIILVPIGVGLYACRRESQRPFGQMLIAAGFLWSTTALAQSDAALPYSIGRLGGWTVTLAAILLVLCYPDGRLRTRFDRLLGQAAVLSFAVLYLPTALLVDGYPPASPWTTCRADCPPNAFMVLDRQPAFLDAWFLPLRESLTVALVLGALGAVAVHAQRASALRRRTLMPVVVAASVLMLALAAFLVARKTGAERASVETLGWIYGLCIPGLAVGLLVGLARWQWYVAGALERLSALLRRDMRPEELRNRLALALEDPPLELVHPRGPGWVDGRGRLLPVPPPTGETALTPIGERRRPVATLIHDAALCDDPAFVEAVRACVLTALERPRRPATVPTRRDLDAARARLLADADRERRRIERDLHDGAQQRLVALRVKLGLASDPDVTDTTPDAAFLQRLGTEVDEIIDEIRSLARGVYPSLLADRGLRDALTSAARRMPLPTRIDCDALGRYDEAIEAAVYFTCLEALQNAAKHGAGATAIWITLRADEGCLSFDVSDDGAGFDPECVPPGVGLTHMRDRLAAVGGELAVDSSPGSGTRVAGAVPVGAYAAPPPGR